jgi:hypothetical protein
MWPLPADVERHILSFIPALGVTPFMLGLHRDRPGEVMVACTRSPLCVAIPENAQCMICCGTLVENDVCVSLTSGPALVYYWSCLSCVRPRMYVVRQNLYRRVPPGQGVSGRLWVVMPSPWDPLIMMVGSFRMSSVVV